MSPLVLYTFWPQHHLIAIGMVIMFFLVSFLIAMVSTNLGAKIAELIGRLTIHVAELAKRHQQQ